MDDLPFFDALQFLDKAFIGDFFHLVGFLVKNIFLLEASHEVAKEIIEDKSARKVNHNEEHHDWHHVRHLTRHDLVEFGLIRLFAVGGFFHDLAEGFGFWRLL